MLLHEDELEIDNALVRRLVERDLPGFAAHPLRRLSVSGSTNVLFRLGDDLLVRLPRQPGGARTIEMEARWLPRMAADLPVAVPEILMVGDPGFGYPERWSVVRWIDGRHPETPETDANELAGDLASLVAALTAIDVPVEARDDPALRWYRCEPLAASDPMVQGYLVECRTIPDLDLDLDACAAVWNAALALPDDSDETPRWLHGDLLAENLLVRDGRLSAVLDFGGLAIGIPTVDLIVAWEVLDSSGRQAFRCALGVDDVTWQRGRAWALAIALGTFPYYGRSMPERSRARLAMAQAVLADFECDDAA